MTVLGAGVIGIEYASIFAALGVYVTLVDTRDRLLPYLDREIVSILERELGELHVEILHDERYVRIDPVPGSPPRVTVETQKGRRITSDVLLYCVGRDGNTKDLGLETIGLVPDKYGLLTVNDDLQTRTRTSTPSATSSATRPSPRPRWSRGGGRCGTRSA